MANGTTNYAGNYTTATYEEPYAQAMRQGYLNSMFDFAKQPTPVPVKQIAGLDPMEMQARRMAPGLGGFTPYIQQGSQMMQGGYGAQQQGQNMFNRGADATNLGIGMYGRGANLTDQGAGLYGTAGGYQDQAAGMYAPGAAKQFYDPYEDSVVQQTLADLKEANIGTNIADKAGQIGQGAFGGSRGRLMAGERQRQLGRGAAEAVGKIRSRGFEGARTAAQNAGSGLSQIGSQFGSYGQGLGTLGGQYGNFGQGMGQLGGQFGQFGQGLGGLGGQMGSMGRNFAGLGITGQQGLMNQITGLGNMGQQARGIQDAMYGAQFDAATGLANEPGKRLGQLGGVLSQLLPDTRSRTQYGQTGSNNDFVQQLKDLLGMGT